MRAVFCLKSNNAMLSFKYMFSFVFFLIKKIQIFNSNFISTKVFYKNINK